MNLTAVAYFFGGLSKIPRGEGHFPRDSNLQKMADVCAVQSADVPRKLVRSEKALNIALGICLRCCFPGPGLGFLVDPFGGAKPRLLRRGKEAQLRVNPEPSTRAQAEGQAQAFRPGSRRVDYFGQGLSAHERGERRRRASSLWDRFL